MRVLSAGSLLLLSFLMAEPNGDLPVPCVSEPLDISAVRLRADAGDSTSQYMLGLHYAFGVVESSDSLSQSLYWFRKSAEQGYAEAEYRLGQAYDSGRGVHLDWKTACYWLRRAAEGGSVNAQFWLGVMYEDGTGVKKSREDAFRWFLTAANGGNADAQVRLGRAYEDGDGVPQDYAQAADWYRKAAEQVPDYGGAGQGRERLGLLYLYGGGVPQDYVEAYKWFALAGLVGNMDKAAKMMTQEQLDEAQKKAKTWTEDHRVPPATCLSSVSNSPIPVD